MGNIAVIGVYTNIEDIKKLRHTNITGYRIIDTDTWKTKDVTRESVERVVCQHGSEGVLLLKNERLYPVLRGCCKNITKAVAIKNNSGTYEVVKCDGEHREFSSQQIIDNIRHISNIKLEDGMLREAEYAEKDVQWITGSELLEARQKAFKDRYICLMVRVYSSEPWKVIKYAVYDTHKALCIMDNIFMRDYVGRNIADTVRIKDDGTIEGTEGILAKARASVMIQGRVEEDYIIACYNKWETAYPRFTQFKLGKLKQGKETVTLDDIVRLHILDGKYRNQVSIVGDKAVIDAADGEYEFSLSEHWINLDKHKAVEQNSRMQKKRAVLGIDNASDIKIDANGCVTKAVCGKGETALIPGSASLIKKYSIKGDEDCNIGKIVIPAGVRLENRIFAKDVYSIGSISIGSEEQVSHLVTSISNIMFVDEVILPDDVRIKSVGKLMSAYPTIKSIKVKDSRMAEIADGVVQYLKSEYIKAARNFKPHILSCSSQLDLLEVPDTGKILIKGGFLGKVEGREELKRLNSQYMLIEFLTDLMKNIDFEKTVKSLCSALGESNSRYSKDISEMKEIEKGLYEEYGQQIVDIKERIGVSEVMYQCVVYTLEGYYTSMNGIYLIIIKNTRASTLSDTDIIKSERRIGNGVVNTSEIKKLGFKINKTAKN